MVGRKVAAPPKTVFEELDVQRLEVREPNGRLRLVFVEDARFPGAVLRGRETPFGRAFASCIGLLM